MSKMKKTVAAAVMAGMIVGGTATVQAAEVTVGTDVSSAYVFRGITFNDGPVVQPYVEVEGLPVTFGVWGNLDIDDYDDTLESGQFSEIDIYASYDLPLPTEAVGLSLSYTEYTYPSGGGDADREVGLTLGADVILAPYVSVYYGLDGSIEKGIYVEAGLGYGLEIADGLELSLGAAIGYLSPDEGEDGFHQYELSAALSYEFVSLGVTYYGQIDDEVLTDDAYDVEVVATLGVSFTF
jgi:hypothetical protein